MGHRQRKQEVTEWGSCSILAAFNSVSNEAHDILNRQLFFFYMCYLNPIFNTNQKHSEVWSIRKMERRSLSFENDALNQLAEQNNKKRIKSNKLQGK